MKSIKFSLILLVVSAMFFSQPLSGETIGFKFSYNTASISGGDINTWIDSYNARWKDYQSYKQGQLDGQFDNLKYGPKFEVELRIPIIFGLALNLSGSHFSSSKEGTVTFIQGTQDQTETDYLKNEIKGFPIKIGLSYTYALPFLENLSVFAGIGRHITFLKYTCVQDSRLEISDFSYDYERNYDFNSEALGVYITWGVEYDLIKQIALVVEAEKVWSQADGFKGKYKETVIETNPIETKVIYEDPAPGPGEEPGSADPGSASLYFYEYKPDWKAEYYFAFRGHKNKPDNPGDYPTYPLGITDIRNLRQGELDLSTFSLKIGIRFKF